MNNQELITLQQENDTEHVYITIRNALLLTCILDIGNLANDKNDRSLSLINIKKYLDDTKIQIELQELRAKVPEISFGGDVPPKEYIDNYYVEQSKNRIEHYKKNLQNLFDKLGDQNIKSKLDLFWKIRCKVAAHTDILNINGQLEFFDTTSVDIKMGGFALLVNYLQEINWLLHAVIENRDLSFEFYDETLQVSIQNFWGLHNSPCATPSNAINKGDFVEDCLSAESASSADAFVDE